MAVIWDVMREIRQNIINSQRIADYCQSTFGKRITVHLGVDEHDLPNVEQFPVVMIDRGGIQYMTNNAIRQIDATIRLLVAIEYDGVSSDQHGKEYEGINALEGLVEIIRTTKLLNSGYYSFTGSSVVSPDEGVRRHPVYAQEETLLVRLRENVYG